MKKSSTATAASKQNFDQKLTIGLDLGDRSSWYCVLDEAGEVIQRAEAGHDSEGDERSLRRDAAQPDSAGDRDALAVGEPIVKRVGP